MNHCRDCNSDYEKPGTCNCFAPNGKRAALAPFVPYVPYVPQTRTPWIVQPQPYPWTIWYSSPTITGTLTAGDTTSSVTTRTDAPFSYTLT